MSDTTPRDQLAQIINEHMEADYAMADAIIAAGWRPPARTVTTVEELDALPKESVVRNAERTELCEKWHDNKWWEMGNEYSFNSDGVALPATVLYEPEEGE